MIVVQTVLNDPNLSCFSNDPSKVLVELARGGEPELEGHGAVSTSACVRSCPGRCAL